VGTRKRLTELEEANMPLVRRGPGLIGTAARAGVAAGVAGRVRRRQEQRWAADDQSAYEQQASPGAAPAAPSEPDYTAELERLAKLRDEGVITAQDFEAKKKQLLGI
jgi:Short C-terminal domain